MIFTYSYPSMRKSGDYLCSHRIILVGVSGFEPRVIAAVEAELSPEVMGYINYISAKSSRTVEDEELLDRIRNLEKI